MKAEKVERFALATVIVAAITLLLMVTGCGGGSQWTMTWTAPTTRADGAPLPVNEIASYKIVASAGTVNVDGNKTSYSAKAPVGTTGYIVAVDIYGLESDPVQFELK